MLQEEKTGYIYGKRSDMSFCRHTWALFTTDGNNEKRNMPPGSLRRADMRLEQLEYFVTAADTGAISAAAQKAKYGAAT